MRVSRIIAAAGTALVGVVSFVVITNHTTAAAHGGMTFPATRTYACYVDGKRGSNGGDLMPTNPACIDAIAQGGKQPLWDWFGNRLADAGGRSREIIPDGHLCGPDTKYDAYNMARADWPVTAVQANAVVTLRYNAWAPHPGTWTQWMTRDGFDVTKPLKWSDLDPVPFSAVTNPPINGSGPDGAEYTWTARLPDKSGRHIIYSIWQRSDSNEVFYNCSDVVFGGSTTPTPSTTPVTTTPAPTTATTVRPPTTVRPTSSTVPPPVTPTTVNRPTTTVPPISGPGGGCVATAKLESAWNSGFQVTVTVSNSGTATINTWKVDLGLAPDAAIASGWSGTYDGLTVTPAAWNGTIAPGQSVTFGFLGRGAATPAPAVTGCTA